MKYIIIIRYSKNDKTKKERYELNKNNFSCGRTIS